MFNKKIIFALILLSVFVVGLQLAEPLNAVGYNAKAIDKGNFKVNGKKIMYIAEYDKKHDSLYIIVNDNYNFIENYELRKTKNHIKAYKHDKIKEKDRLLKTYKTKKSIKDFYFSEYKKIAINNAKKDAKKAFKK